MFSFAVAYPSNLHMVVECSVRMLPIHPFSRNPVIAYFYNGHLIVGISTIFTDCPRTRPAEIPHRKIYPEQNVPPDLHKKLFLRESSLYVKRDRKPREPVPNYANGPTRKGSLHTGAHSLVDALQARRAHGGKEQRLHLGHRVIRGQAPDRHPPSGTCSSAREVRRCAADRA